MAMSSKKQKSLYHYCSLDTFLNIIKNSSIWLSDIQKSNDSREMAWFREKYYDFILDKYNNTDDLTVKSICELILSMAVTDGYEKCPLWLLPATKTNSEEIANTFFSLRTYAFCLSELPDSLGQWRGYADNGCGVAIGFSREYLDAISGYSLRCPSFNFLIGSISYRTNFSSLFEKMFDIHDKNKFDEFILKSMIDLTRTSALFKHPSFKEEKEWRIIYSMDDYGLNRDILTFKDFRSISSDKYKKNFSDPKIDYIAKGGNMIPHIEIKFNDLPKAIESIIIGPKCEATEKDIRHVLLRFGVLDSFEDSKIKIVRSASSYR